VPTTSHWGAYRVHTDAETGGIAVTPHPADPSPSPLLGNVAGALRHSTRVRRPGDPARLAGACLARARPVPTDRRGTEPFVEVEWDEAVELLAAELLRVRERYGNEAVYGGSYGWASAGRFHHAQSQLHRFLNMYGGYTSSRNSYSLATSLVVLPHIVGDADAVLRNGSSWPTIIENTELIVAFGGIPAKNVFVTPGGVTKHVTPGALDALAQRGVRVTLISPLRADLPRGTAEHDLDTDWIPIEPATDTALMLALAHTLLTEGLHDQALPHRYTSGFEVFAKYLDGSADGVPKSAEWASAICGSIPSASGPWHAGWPPRARSSPSPGPCSASSTASSRSGPGSRWPRCSGRSGCPAAASGTDTARWATSATTAPRCGCRTCRRERTRYARSSPWPGSPTCCSTRAPSTTTTASV
jgi:biotin/methionine sulfoxide reductase